MLTDTQIRRLPTPERERLVPAGGRLGLYLRLRTTGRRTWMTRRRIGGAWRVETLGDWPQLTALNARRMASTAETRQAAAVTFSQATEMFYAEAVTDPSKKSLAVGAFREAARDPSPANRVRCLSRERLARLAGSPLAPSGPINYDEAAACALNIPDPQGTDETLLSE